MAAIKKAVFFIFLDIISIFLAVWLSFSLKFDFAIPSQFDSALNQTFIFALIFYIPIFYFFGLYSFSWSYVSVRELIALIVSSAFSICFISLFIFVSDEFSHFTNFPRSILFILYFLVILFAGLTRFLKRIYLEFIASGLKGERTLIIGAGDAGEQILRNIQNSQSTPYSPIGFADDNPSKKGNYIHGVKVLGPIDELGEIIKDNAVEKIIVALPSAQTEVLKKAVGASRKAGIKEIKILPPISEIINGKVSLADIKDFKLEDLIDRNPLLYNFESVKNFVQGKRILVTGAAGSIGSEICRQISEFSPASLLMLDQDETGIFNISKEITKKFSTAVSIVANIQDKERISKIFQEYHPEIIFHAAAYKHVPLMQEQPEEAVKNNICGTKNLAKISFENGAEKFIFISTDKAVNPVSVMGMSKRAGEIICRNFNFKGKTKFISVRFGNVLGSRGSVIPVFKEQIKTGGPVEVTHEEMRRYFMIIPEAVSLVLQAGQMGNGGEVFVLNMGNPIKILDLAKDVIRLSGFEPDKDIPIIFTNPRPGEKMFEEILTAEEGSTATENQNIFIANLAPIDEAKFEENLIKLNESLNGANKLTIVENLGLLIKKIKL